MAQTVDYRIGRITDLRLPEGANFAAEFTFSGLSLTGYEATLTARRGANGGRVPFTWSKSGISLTSTTVSFDIAPNTTDDSSKAFSTVTAQGSTDYALTIRQSGGGAIIMRLQGTVQWVEDVGDYDPGTSGSNQIAVTVGSGTAVTVSLTNNGHSPLALDATTADVFTVNNQVLSADDAGSDKLLFWDESEGKLSHATIGSGLTMTGTTLSAAGGAGTGTVTSVAVSGSDGIEVDSGSPITSSGTIALGINASTLKSHLSLGSVEDTALSTWTGSTSITTLGTIATGTVPAANVSGLGDAAAKNTGTTAGTVAAGDHSHAQLHDAATVSGNGISISGQQITLSIGTGANQVAAGDHTHTLASLGIGSTDSPTFAGLALSAGTLTASTPVSLTQTWNNAAVAFTGLRFNATNTASSISSLLLDLQVGGASQFRVRRDGVFFAASAEMSGYASYSNGNCSANPNASGSFVVGANSGFHFVSTSSNSFIAPDTFLRGPAPATLQLGVTHATTPTAQTLRAHSVTTGTGASLTLQGGSGSVARGNVVLEGGNRSAYVASPTSEQIRDILISHGLMAAS